MNYSILAYETDADMSTRKDPSRSGEYRAAWAAYAKALADAGIVVAGAGLDAPSTATTVRLRGGKRQVQDGPFADTKEILGGFVIIDVPDLDKALEWASRCPSAATGCVEVRPTLPPLGR